MVNGQWSRGECEGGVLGRGFSVDNMAPNPAPPPKGDSGSFFTYIYVKNDVFDLSNWTSKWTSKWVRIRPLGDVSAPPWPVPVELQN